MADLDIERPAPPPRETYHHGDLRNAFLDAALTLVEERGVSGFSLREAARRIGVSPAAAYRHFADKDSLLEALAERGSRRMAADMVDAAAAARAGREGAAAAIAELWAYAEAIVDFCVRNPAYLRVMSSCRGPGMGVPDRPRPALALAVASFDELLRLGAIGEDARARAPLAAWTTVFGLAWILVEGGGPEACAAAGAALDAALRTSFLGLGVDPALLPPEHTA